MEDSEIDLLSLRIQEIFDTEAGSTLYSEANRPENIPPKIHQKFGDLSKFIKLHKICAPSLS